MNDLRSIIASLEEERRKVLSATESRLTSWVLLGNAAALLMCFNGLLGHAVCDWNVFRPLVITFAVGLVAAFLSAAISHARVKSEVSLWQDQLMNMARFEHISSYVGSLRTKGAAAVTDAELVAADKMLDEAPTLAVTAYHRFWAKFWERLSELLFLAGGGAFAVGIVSALTVSDYTRALCPP